jgi:SAM-dependent methyltransferase
MTKKILNLGAGNRIIEGADNHDLTKHRDEINLVFDLNNINNGFNNGWNSELHQIGLSYQDYKNGYYDEIQFISVIEHLNITPIQALNECWHLLKPGGVLVVKYPHYTSPSAYHDPTHKHWLTEHSLDYVDPSTQFGKDYNYYTPFKWQILTPVDKRIVQDRNVKMILRPIK